MNLIKRTSVLVFIFVSSVISLYSVPLIVNGNLTINGPGTFQYDYIQVNPRATLTFSNCAVLIAQGQEVFVDVGGKLILDNSLFSVQANSAIPNYWNGIRVKGDFNAIQSNANQGVLILKNNSIIEKALVGVSLGRLKYINNYNISKVSSQWYLDGGGIIQAENSTIQNCMFGVVFSPYYNSIMQRPYANLSYFRNVKFVWDKFASNELCYNSLKKFKTHLELNYVHDIRIIGCTFSNTIKYHTEWWKSFTSPDGVDFRDDYLARGTGIYAFGASFYVHSDGPCSPIDANNNCKKCDGSENVFEYLSTGINIQSHKSDVAWFNGLPPGNLTTFVEISDCNFHDNLIGVNSNYTVYYPFSELDQSDLPNYYLHNIYINRNWFKIDNSYYEYFFENHAHDIYLSYTGDVDISDNTFIHESKNIDQFHPSNHMNQCIGDTKLAYLRINNSGYWPVKIHRNYFNDMDGVDEPCGRVANLNYFSGINKSVTLTCNKYFVDRFNYYDFGGASTMVHHDVTIENDENGFSDIGNINEGSGNQWSKDGTYNYNNDALPIYRKTNNIAVYNSSSNASPFNLYTKGTDMPQSIAVNLGFHPFNLGSSSNMTSVDIQNARNGNSCVESNYCSYYSPFQFNPNISSNYGNTNEINNNLNVDLPTASLELSPNPLSDQFLKLELTSTITGGLMLGEIEIRDMYGNIIGKIKINPISGTFTYFLDTLNYLPGYYFITYMDENGRKVTKIFVKH